jgi:hypothetical protein
MVSHRTFGRMGNALFQAAVSFSFAKKHGLEWSMPNWTTNDFWSPLYLQHLVHPNYNRREDVLINESCHEYQVLPFREEWRNVNIVLNGYFQSERYFYEYRQEILEAFNYPYEMNEGVCSLQARFGDYLTISGKHILVDKDYILSAMNYMYENAGIERFKVFSDDLNYFKTHFGDLHNFEYSENKSIEQDLIDISCCEHNINSSSTFAWWGSWLNRNPNKITITQSKWFQDGWMGMNTNDIVPENWIKL